MSKFLRSTVPTIVPDVLDLSQEQIDALLSHSERQALMFAVQRIAPDVVREAMASGFSGADLEAWLLPRFEDMALPDGETRSDERPPRGSYMTSNVTIRPLLPVDVEPLYQAAIEPRSAHRWRFRGVTPNPNAFYEALYDPAVIAQFMVQASSSGEAVGLVVGYDADRVSRHCKIAVQRLLPGARGLETSGLMVEGLFVFVQYLFDHFDFQKVYLEVPEYNMSMFAGGGRFPPCPGRTAFKPLLLR